MKDVGKGPWRCEPPPSVGWWPASVNKSKNVLRWWNGKEWSNWVDNRYTSKEAQSFAKQKSYIIGNEIKWRERADWWPKRSRT